jgi:hypothetical protein
VEVIRKQGLDKPTTIESPPEVISDPIALIVTMKGK